MQQKRVDQILSNYGYCSRREARAWCKQGLVELDGEAITDPAAKVDPAQVLIDGEPIDHVEGILILMHKPAGYVCSHNPSEGVLVYDLLPWQWLGRKPMPVTVGRLDKDTTGALLISDDTQLVHRLTSPKHKVPKVYEVTLDKPLADGLETIFASGSLMLSGDDKPCLPALYRRLDEHKAELEIVEGRYHQVKRMFAALGYEVTALHRRQFGNLVLGDLAEGEFRDVCLDEIII